MVGHQDSWGCLCLRGAGSAGPPSGNARYLMQSIRFPLGLQLGFCRPTNDGMFSVLPFDPGKRALCLPLSVHRRAQSFSCILFATPQTVALWAFLSTGLPRQEYWSGLPFPTPGDLPDPGTQTHTSCVSCISRKILYHGSRLGSPCILASHKHWNTRTTLFSLRNFFEGSVTNWANGHYRWSTF